MTLDERSLMYGFLLVIITAFLKFPHLFMTYGPGRGLSQKKWVTSANRAGSWVSAIAVVLISFGYACGSSFSRSELQHLSRASERSWVSCVFFTLLILLFICAIRFLPHINLSLGNDPGDDGGGGGSGGKDGPTIIITGGSNAYKTGFDFAQGMDKGDPANSWKYQDKGNRN